MWFRHTGIAIKQVVGQVCDPGWRYWITDHTQARSAAQRGSDRAIVAYGTNDLANTGNNLAALQGLLTPLWTNLANKGMKVYACTIVPRTTSTYGWATTGNQTAYNSSNAISTSSLRAQLNDWIRTTPAPLTGYLETADLAETWRNFGWLAMAGSVSGFAVLMMPSPPLARHCRQR